MSEQKEGEIWNLIKNPKLVNNPNPTLAEESYSVYGITSANGVGGLNHLGTVEAVDHGSAYSKATALYGKHAVDYIRPKGEFPQSNEEK